MRVRHAGSGFFPSHLRGSVSNGAHDLLELVRRLAGALDVGDVVRYTSMLRFLDGVIVGEHHHELDVVGTRAMQDVLTGTGLWLGDQDVACCNYGNGRKVFDNLVVPLLKQVTKQPLTS